MPYNLTTAPTPAYNTAPQANRLDLPNIPFEDMTNPEKFESLRSQLEALKTEYYTKHWALEENFAKHRHAPDGAVVVEYKRQY